MKKIKDLEKLRRLAKKDITVLVKTTAGSYGAIEQKFKVRFFATEEKWKVTRLGKYEETVEYFLGQRIKDSIINDAIRKQGLFLDDGL